VSVIREQTQVKARPFARLRVLDGVRGLALLSVLANHGGVFPAGFIGVDIFFVLSGFLITVLLCQEWDRYGRIDWWGFYLRRFRRLAPESSPSLHTLVMATLSFTVAVPSWYLIERGFFAVATTRLVLSARQACRPVMNPWPWPPAANRAAHGHRRVTRRRLRPRCAWSRPETDADGDRGLPGHVAGHSLVDRMGPCWRPGVDCVDGAADSDEPGWHGLPGSSILIGQPDLGWSGAPERGRSATS
jgi:hypothetical protein